MKKIIFILTICTMTLVNAQSRKQQLISDFQRAKDFTVEYIQAFPQDQFGYKPTAEERTFAAQMLHLSDALVSFTCAATDKTPFIENGALEKSNEENAHKVLAEVIKAYDFAISSIEELDEKKLDEKVKLFGAFELTREVALRKSFEHQTHHRAQTAVYLRLNGVVPPAMKLF